MKKFIIPIFLFFSISYAKADYLYEKTNQCVYNLTPYYAKHVGWCFDRRIDNTRHCKKRAKYTDFINGFVLKHGKKCKMYKELQDTGMTFNQFQFNQALLANMYGFFIFFLVGFLFILQGRR